MHEHRGRLFSNSYSHSPRGGVCEDVSTLRLGDWEQDILDARLDGRNHVFLEHIRTIRRDGEQ